MNKSKVMLSMVIIIIALALSLGATMAWFQDEDPASPATFQAGTVIIEAVGTYTISGGDGYKNVNPGDCFVLCWEFENKGSKTVELRTQIDPVWIDVTELNDNVFILPQYASDWVLHEDGGDLWAYYLGGPVASEETVQLCLVVYFDGPLTDDRYQGKEFTMNGEVEAVQASNNAPSEVWGAVWDTVNADGYEFNYTLKWPTFDLAKMYCYNGENGGTGETAYVGGTKVTNEESSNAWFWYIVPGDDSPLTIFATDDNLEIGEVDFSEDNNDATFNISLNSGWNLKSVNEAIKLMSMDTQPTGRPTGKNYKDAEEAGYGFRGDSSDLGQDITITKNNFYVIHLDVYQD